MMKEKPASASDERDERSPIVRFEINEQAFKTKYREQRPFLTTEAADSNYFSVADLEQAFFSSGAKSPSLMVHDGTAFVPEDHYSEGFQDVHVARRRLLKPRLAKFLEDGATVVFNRIEAHSLRIKELCLDIASFASAHTIANGYFSTASTPSFGKHWDTHDVFAVQLLGRKHWQLFAPTFDLPVAGQTSKNFKKDCPTIASMDVVLTPGDVLYVPRGWWHEVRALNEPTFHVAIGTHAPLIRNFVSWLCAARIADHVEFRRLFNSGPEAIQEAARRLAELVCDPGMFEQYRRHLAESERIDSPFSMDADLCLRPRKTLLNHQAFVSSFNVGDLDATDSVNGSPLPAGGLERALLQSAQSDGLIEPRKVADLLNQPEVDIQAAITALWNSDHVHFRRRGGLR